MQDAAVDRPALLEDLVREAAGLALRPPQPLDHAGGVEARLATVGIRGRVRTRAGARAAPVALRPACSSMAALGRSGEIERRSGEAAPAPPWPP